MYTKEQASSIKQAFWTAFGQYMALTPGASGERINWINYKTGLKHLHFKMQADRKSAFIAIEITHPEADIQELIFEQFREFEKLLCTTLGEEWNWDLHTYNDQHKMVSRIYAERENVNIFRQEDWPELISFFRPRLIALDEFWSTAHYGFETFK